MEATRPRGDDALRRVRGEPLLDSATLEQAQIWIGVYTEMTMFWRQTATDLNLWLGDVTSEPARRALQDVDQRLIEARHALVRHRLHLWELRARELSSGSADPGGATASRSTAVSIPTRAQASRPGEQ